MAAQALNINNSKRVSKPMPAYLGDYRVLCQVGEGTYGKVYKAQHRVSNKMVALKVLFPDSTTDEDGGISVTTLREVRYLQSLASQPNIIHLEECFFTPDQELVLVFEYMDHDLSGLSSHPDVKFSSMDIKFIMRQILEGLHQIHSAGIMHRDIKAANILLNRENAVKIGDFGLATSYQRRSEFSTNVVTLWYRAPELLLGQARYSSKVDLWSAGCIFVELMDKRSPLPGKDEFNQMELIFKLCGFPNEHNWPGVSRLPEYKKLEALPKYLNKIDDVFRHYPPKALDLLKKLLTPDPEKRISAMDALDHDFFWTEEPFLPPSASSMKFSYWVPSVHEYELRMQEQQMRQRNAVFQQQARSNHSLQHNSNHIPQITQNASSALPQYLQPQHHSSTQSHSSQRPCTSENPVTANQRIGNSQRTALTMANNMHKNGVKTESMKKSLPTRATSSSSTHRHPNSASAAQTAALVSAAQRHALLPTGATNSSKSHDVNRSKQEAIMAKENVSAALGSRSMVVKLKIAPEQAALLGKRKRSEVSV